MAMNPRLLRPTSGNDSPASIPGLALWLDAAAPDALYTTDAGPVTAVSSPLDISGCALWLDGADSSVASMTLDGTSVSAWRDKSGNGRDFTAAGGARPTITASGLNGRSVVTFDGTDDQLTNATNIVGLANVTMLAVAYRQTGAYGGIISSATPTDSSPALLIENTNVAVRGYGNLSVIIGGFTGPAVISGRVSSGATELFTDGLVRDSDAVSGTLGAATTTAIGTYRQAAQNFLSGYIAEIIVYPAALSTADRARVEAYLANKWGIANVHAPAVTASQPVGYWRDRSGNGRHATQSTAASRPVVGTQNGRTALTFDGANDNLWVEDYSVENNLSGLTRFLVFEVGAASQILATTTTVAKTASAGGSTWWQRFGTNWYGYSGDGIRYHGGTADTAAHVATNFFDGSLAATFGVRLQNIVDGALLPVVGSLGTLATTTGGSAAKLAVGSNAGINNFVSGKLCELLCYTRALTPAQRRTVERYLARKWGITLAPQVANAEAQDWINRVYANGGTVSTSTASAVSTFCDAIDAAGIRDRFARLSLFCGDSLNAALVPLYRSYTFGGTVLGNSVDQSLGSPSFGVGDYSLTTGLQGNGTSKYLNTGVPMNFTTLQNYHLSSFVMANPTGNAGFIGADTNGDGVSPRGFQSLVSFAAATRIWVWYNWGNGGGLQADNSSNSYPPSLITGVGSAASNALYVGGSSVATAAAQNNETISRAFPIYVFAANNRDANLLYLANARLGGYSIGRSLTAANVAAYNSAIAAFNSAIGRT